MSLSANLRARYEELGRKLELATRLNSEQLERSEKLLAKLQELNSYKE